MCRAPSLVSGGREVTVRHCPCPVFWETCCSHFVFFWVVVDRRLNQLRSKPAHTICSKPCKGLSQIPQPSSLLSLRLLWPLAARLLLFAISEQPGSPVGAFAPESPCPAVAEKAVIPTLARLAPLPPRVCPHRPPSWEPGPLYLNLTPQHPPQPRPLPDLIFPQHLSQSSRIYFISNRSAGHRARHGRARDLWEERSSGGARPAPTRTHANTGEGNPLMSLSRTWCHYPHFWEKDGENICKSYPVRGVNIQNI